MKRDGLIILILLLMPLVVSAEVSGSFIDALKLKSTKIEDATVYYEPCFEEKLPLFRTAYLHFRNPENRIQQSEAKPEAIFEDIENIIGTDEEARNIQKKMANELTDLVHSVFPPEPTFYLMRQSTIKDYMRKGGTIPDFSYDKETDMVTYELGFSATLDSVPRKQELTIAVPSIAEFEPQVKEGFRMISSITIHEIAELSLIQRLRTRTPRMRWFTDGFANVIAYEISKKHFGQSQAEELLEAYDIENYSDLKDQLNLRYWMIINYNLGNPANPFPLEAERRLEIARYSYAFYEAKRLVDAHGIDCVKRIIDLFAVKTKGVSVLRAESILYEIISEVTGEDLKKRFLQYQSFSTEEEGRKIYTDKYNQAKKENNREQMILNLLRKMEVYDTPFLPESQDIRREIAVLLSDLGHHDVADMAMHQWVIEWDISGKLSGLHTRVFEIIGKAFFMTYALKAKRPEAAVDYADDILEIKPPNSVNIAVLPIAKFLAMTVKMLQAKREGDVEEALELAKRVCELKPVSQSEFYEETSELYEIDLCYQMAQQILNEKQ